MLRFSKKSFTDAMDNQSVIALYLSSAVVLVAHIVLLTLKVHPVNDSIPLHYTVYLGIDFFGPWYYIFIFPCLAFLTLAINFFVSVIIRESYFSNVLLASFSLVAQIIFLTSSILVIKNIF